MENDGTKQAIYRCHRCLVFRALVYITIIYALMAGMWIFMEALIDAAILPGLTFFVGFFPMVRHTLHRHPSLVIAEHGLTIDFAGYGLKTLPWESIRKAAIYKGLWPEPAVTLDLVNPSVVTGGGTTGWIDRFMPEKWKNPIHIFTGQFDIPNEELVDLINAHAKGR